MPWQFINLLKKLLEIMSKLFNCICILLCLTSAACTTSVSKPDVSPPLVRQQPAHHESPRMITTNDLNEGQGKALWYALSAHGMRTTSGEIYDLYGLTAAHASLPLFTPIRVTHLQTGAQVIVTVNDRLLEPNVLVKLSYQAAQQIGLLTYPSSPVAIQRLSKIRTEKRE